MYNYLKLNDLEEFPCLGRIIWQQLLYFTMNNTIDVFL